MKISRIVAAVSTTLLLSPIGAFAETGVTDNQIVIGISNVQSGPSAEAGQQTNVGINAMFKAVNAEGGINGRKFKVLSCDDRYEPEQAISCFKNLTGQGVFGLTGLYGSVCLARYIPMAETNNVPLAGLYPGTHFIGDPPKQFVFNIRASYRDEMREAVNHLWKDAGLRRFAVIYQNDAFGADCLEGIRLALQDHGAQVVAAASYTRNKTDIGNAVKDIKADNPEVVFLGAVYKPCVDAVRAAHQSGWHPIFVMNSGTSVELFSAEAGKDTEDALFTEVVPPPSSDLPLVAKYRAAMKQFYPDQKLGYCNLRGYMDALIWREGLKLCGKEVTRDRFVHALEGINHMDIGLGKGMELNFNANDHLGLHKVFFGAFQNGQVIAFSAWKSLLKKRVPANATK